MKIAVNAVAGKPTVVAMEVDLLTAKAIRRVLGTASYKVARENGVSRDDVEASYVFWDKLDDVLEANSALEGLVK